VPERGKPVCECFDDLRRWIHVAGMAGRLRTASAGKRREL
jgi:hypothetical protein